MLGYREGARKILKKILYQTDFSWLPNKALNRLRHLKEAGTEEVTVLHVFDEWGVDAVPGSVRELA
jgi:hypothetical protein